MMMVFFDFSYLTNPLWKYCIGPLKKYIVHDINGISVGVGSGAGEGVNRGKMALKWLWFYIEYC